MTTVVLPYIKPDTGRRPRTVLLRRGPYSAPLAQGTSKYLFVTQDERRKWIEAHTLHSASASQYPRFTLVSSKKAIALQP